MTDTGERQGTGRRPGLVKRLVGSKPARAPKAGDRRRGGAQVQARRSGEPLAPEAPLAPERSRSSRERSQTAPIDPRIRRRRVEVQRDAGRRRLRRLVIAASAAGIGAGLYAITLTPLLDVDHVEIGGAGRTGERAVLDALGIRRGDALLTADVGRAARELARLPWVATADVRRSWPNTIEVDLVERAPVAAIAARGGRWVIVDRDGRQLAVEAEPAVELVRVAGVEVEPEPGAHAGERFTGALDLAAAVPPSIRPAISALWPQRDGSVEATVVVPGGGDAAVRFGPPDQLQSKLVALAAVLERADLADVRVIDLRVPGAPALTRG